MRGLSVVFVNTLFKKGLDAFKQVKEKEEVLKVHVRYLKFLISIQFNEQGIKQAFRVGETEGVES